MMSFSIFLVGNKSIQIDILFGGKYRQKTLIEHLIDKLSHIAAYELCNGFLSRTESLSEKLALSAYNDNARIEDIPHHGTDIIKNNLA